MSWKRALEADARLAAKNATKIRAALRQSINATSIVEAYQQTQPQPTGNLAQTRARARSWAIINVRVNLETFKEVLIRVLAEGYVLGDVAAREQLALARERQKATDTEIDWSRWRPGDAVTAILVKPPKAFQQLLARYDITLKGFNSTTLDDIGNALGEAIELGLSAKQTAKKLSAHIASPSRALTIAVTEQNRAMSAATLNRYKEAGTERVEWIASDPCPKCLANDGQVVAIGAAFPSGDTQPPAHPNCRCALLPVIEGFEEETTMLDGTPMPSTQGDLSSITDIVALEKPEARYGADKFTPEKFVELLPKTAEGLPNFDAPFIAKDGIQATQNIMKEQNFLKPVTVVEAQQFDKLQKEGWTTFYRGYSATSETELNQYITDFVQGDKPHLSMGLYGNGTYFGDLQTARAYSMADLGGDKVTIGRVIEGALHPKAKIISHLDLGNLSVNWVYHPKNAELAKTYIPNRADIAIMHGYDAIRVPQEDGGDYFVILNRGAVVIKNG